MSYKNANIAVRKLCTVINGIACIILAFLVLLLVVNIIGRFIKSPVTGSYEGVQFGFALIVCFSIAATALAGKHIEIDLIFNRYPQKLKSVLEILNQIAGIGLFTLIVYRLCADGAESARLVEKSSTLGLPVSLFKYLLAFGFALLGLVIFMKLWELIGGQKCRQR